MFLEIPIIICLSFILNLAIIKFSLHKGIFQPQRANLKNNQVVPTFGGLSFLCLFIYFARYDWKLSVFVNLIGVLGFFDDFAKVAVNTSHGLSSKIKLFIEFLLAFAFISSLNFQRWGLPSIFAVIWGSFVLVSTINAVNVTDGVDSLATVVSIFCLLFIYIKTGDPLSLLSTMALIPFLILNKSPARIYMGDVGALSLGALIGSLFLKYQMELALPFVGVIFVIETLSSLIQIMSRVFFGKPIFLVAPLHHHLILNGWNKNQILFWFFTITILFFEISFFLF